MEIERIEELVNKRTLTAEDREEIRAAADAAGMKYTLKEHCRGCYERLLLRLYEAAEITDVGVSPDGWRLKNPRQAFEAGGVRWDNTSIRTRNVGGLHKTIIETFFVKDEN